MPLTDPWDNSSPVPITPASNVFDNSSPAAVAQAAFDNTSPVAEAIPSQVFDNTSPSPVAQVAFDNTSPVSASVVSGVFDNTSPGAVAPPSFDNASPVPKSQGASAFDNNNPDLAPVGWPLKLTCDVASTANIDVSTDAHLQTVDGVELPEGTTVLLKNQTNAWENGPYIIVDEDGTGIWTRQPAITPLVLAFLSGIEVRILSGPTNRSKDFYLSNYKSLDETSITMFGTIFPIFTDKAPVPHSIP